MDKRLFFGEGVTLECAKNAEVRFGMNDLTIAGEKPELKVANQTSTNMYFLLSAYAKDIRPYGGWIGWSSYNTSSFKLIAKGFGAYNERIVLLELEGAMIDDWIVLCPEEGTYSDAKYLHVSRQGVDYFENYEEAVRYARNKNLNFFEDNHRYLDVVWPNSEECSEMNAELRMKKYEKSLTGAQV